MADEHGIEAFEVGEDDQLFQRSVIAHVARGVRMGVAPLLRGLAEKGDVEQIRLLGVNEGGLGFGDGGRDERIADGVGMDAIVDFRQSALEVPIEFEAVVFVGLEAAELFDQIYLKFGTDPHAELKGDVGVGIGAAVASGGGLQTDGLGLLNPFLDADLVAVETGLTFN